MARRKSKPIRTMKTINPNIATLRMLSSIKGEMWMIRHDKIQHFALCALEIPQTKEAFDLSDFYPMRQAAQIDRNGIGHVEIKGALLNKSPGIYEKLGLVTTYRTIKNESAALAEAGARAIIFHVDSPGGTVAGCAECAQFIAMLPVPTAAHADGLACSAAYKLACSCNHLTATPSSEIGNIGTILAWQDCSEFWKQNGIEFKAITNEGADLKSTFHLEPDEAQLEFLQQSINQAGAEFRQWVETMRPQVSAEVFRAGWYHGTTALSLGLADGIGTAAETIAEFLQKSPV